MTLAEYLKKSGKTASSLAALVGVSVSTITRIARREQKPMAGLAYEIETATGRKVRVADLVAP